MKYLAPGEDYQQQALDAAAPSSGFFRLYAKGPSPLTGRGSLWAVDANGQIITISRDIITINASLVLAPDVGVGVCTTSPGAALFVLLPKAASRVQPITLWVTGGGFVVVGVDQDVSGNSQFIEGCVATQPTNITNVGAILTVTIPPAGFYVGQYVYLFGASGWTTLSPKGLYQVTGLVGSTMTLTGVFNVVTPTGTGSAFGWVSACDVITPPSPGPGAVGKGVARTYVSDTHGYAIVGTAVDKTAASRLYTRAFAR